MASPISHHRIYSAPREPAWCPVLRREAEYTLYELARGHCLLDKRGSNSESKETDRGFRR